MLGIRSRNFLSIFYVFRTPNETLFVSYLGLKIVIVVHDVDPDILTSKACEIRMQMKREKKFEVIMFPC